jgi:OFA family oxalate/formate antiporter-like MFS transporter
MQNTRQTTGWIITSAALGINLLLGLLYAWSVFKKELVVELGWSNTLASLPYTVSAAVFAFTMIFAGRAQDKYGPRIVAMLSGLMFGGGLILWGFTTCPVIMVFTCGIIWRIDIGLGYSATTPCAINGLNHQKRDLYQHCCFRCWSCPGIYCPADSLLY